jgi:hypothetical protein
MKKIDLLLKNVESKIAFRNNKNTSVSKSDVAWHLDHVLKVINGISSVVKKSNPDDYKPSFNFKRILVLSLGKIPRGKAKAPETVVSIGEVTLEELNLQLEKAKIAVLDFETCAPKSNFKHPYFGALNLKQTIRFLEIHTHHHLKIVEDIINKQ